MYSVEHDNTTPEDVLIFMFFYIVWNRDDNLRNEDQLKRKLFLRKRGTLARTSTA